MAGTAGKITPPEPKFQDDVAAFDIAEIAQPLSERIERWRSLFVTDRQNADTRDLALRPLSA
jgi:hypothetical protein